MDEPDLLTALAHGESFERFRAEYDTAHRAMRRSLATERLLLDKCRELSEQVVNYAIKLQKAVRLKRQDDVTIAELRREAAKAWKIADTATQREQAAQELIGKLKTQMDELRERVRELGGAVLFIRAQYRTVLLQSQQPGPLRDALLAEVGMSLEAVLEEIRAGTLPKPFAAAAAAVGPDAARLSAAAGGSASSPAARGLRWMPHSPAVGVVDAEDAAVGTVSFEEWRHQRRMLAGSEEAHAAAARAVHTPGRSDRAVRAAGGRPVDRSSLLHATLGHGPPSGPSDATIEAPPPSRLGTGGGGDLGALSERAALLSPLQASTRSAQHRAGMRATTSHGRLPSRGPIFTASAASLSLASRSHAE